ncbi:hypothetical protein SAMN05421857_4101 [Chryseobacterium formosense]|uniref:hypothetical protein n=1 Tax=Chryseobacterium formosense TaxID=236814 RepID=UPI0008F128FF|nr:hypothetical protein [Chryseobacterium formosense]SFT91523.1 hypothetical protein SAMN05421857_4101 [Chryseobacterium formosense]
MDVCIFATIDAFIIASKLKNIKHKALASCEGFYLSTTRYNRAGAKGIPYISPRAEAMKISPGHNVDCHNTDPNHRHNPTTCH